MARKSYRRGRRSYGRKKGGRTRRLKTYYIARGGTRM